VWARAYLGLLDDLGSGRGRGRVKIRVRVKVRVRRNPSNPNLT
jgi:hypothetical protein